MVDITRLDRRQLAGLFEPQRQDNWRFTVPDLQVPGAQELEVAVESMNLPTTNIEEVELQFLNSTVYVAGKASPEPSPLVIKDYIDLQVARALLEWHHLAFNPVTGRTGLARDYKKRGRVELFAPNGTAVRTWAMIGCWIPTMNPGALDMTSGDKVLVEATIRFDRGIPNYASWAPTQSLV